MHVKMRMVPIVQLLLLPVVLPLPVPPRLPERRLHPPVVLLPEVPLRAGLRLREVRATLVFFSSSRLVTLGKFRSMARRGWECFSPISICSIRG